MSLSVTDLHIEELNTFPKAFHLVPSEVRVPAFDITGWGEFASDKPWIYGVPMICLLPYVSDT